MNAQNKKIEKAKQTLKDAGYFVDNLWHIDDIKGDYECDDEQAHDILYDALKNDATMEQIWMSISITAEDKYSLKQKLNFP